MLSWKNLLAIAVICGGLVCDCAHLRAEDKPAVAPAPAPVTTPVPTPAPPEPLKLTIPKDVSPIPALPTIKMPEIEFPTDFPKFDMPLTLPSGHPDITPGGILSPPRGLGGMLFGRPASPIELELTYFKVWMELASTYHDPQKLKDAKIADQLKATRGTLKTRDDLNAAIHKLVDSIGDRYTTYTSMEELGQQLLDDSGSLGFSVKADGDDYRLDFIDQGSKVYGTKLLRRGDVIRSIGGQALKGKTLAEVKKLLVGKLGEQAEIVYAHDGKEEKLSLTFADAEEVKSECKMLKGKIAYLRLADFEDSHVMGLSMDWLALHEKAQGDVRGIILDLRGNPGGNVKTAYSTASNFIEKGPVVTLWTREGAAVRESRISIEPAIELFLSGTEDDLGAVIAMQRLPMVVLTDSFTASAAEILCGALKDNDRATVVGETTFGKGVGYNETPFASGVLQVTSMKIATASGFKYHGKGIGPNQEVVPSRGAKTDEVMDAGVKVLKGKIAKDKKAAAKP